MDNLKALDRAKDFAERVSDKAVWSKVGEVVAIFMVLRYFGCVSSCLLSVRRMRAEWFREDWIHRVYARQRACPSLVDLPCFIITFRSLFLEHAGQDWRHSQHF